jgi:electron transport complex protein RnfD
MIKGGQEAAEGVMPGYFDLFIGNVGGCIGETSVLALLIGAAYLFYRRVITPEIPFAFIGTFAVFVWIFGGESLFAGDILYHVMAGGLMIGAFFMATDYSTSPVTSKGRIIMGVGCGVLAALNSSLTTILRRYDRNCTMNKAVPLIDRYTVQEASEVKSNWLIY